MRLSGCDCHGEMRGSGDINIAEELVHSRNLRKLLGARGLPVHGPFRVRTKASIRSARGGREPTPSDDAQPILGYRGNALVAAAFQLRAGHINSTRITSYVPHQQRAPKPRATSEGCQMEGFTEILMRLRTLIPRLRRYGLTGG